MQHIETIELGSSQSSITFSSIPQDYDDLVLKLSLRANRASTGEAVLISFNASTTNFSNVFLQGNGSSASSSTLVRFVASATGTNATSNTFSNSSVYISNYTASQAKSFSSDNVIENNATESFQTILSNLWNDTSAITSITLTTDNAVDFLAGCTASLYGVTAGGDGTVTTA